MAHLQMMFPARNLHLSWIFHGYVKQPDGIMENRMMF